MADDTKPAADEPDDHPAAGLSRVERSAASLLGLVGAGLGGFSVFVSDNQAGSTALLVLGAVFLLMGVQGTAIRRATKDSVEMERRYRRAKVVSQGERVLEEQGPDKAEAFIDGAAAIDPGLKTEPDVRYLERGIYAEQVFEALRRVVKDMLGDQARVLREQRYGRTRLDALIEVTNNRGIAVEIKSTGSTISSKHVEMAGRQLAPSRLPGLAISNADLTSAALQAADDLNTADTPIRFVTWRGLQDDAKLAGAVQELLSL